MKPGVEYLTVARVKELREQLLPLFSESCDGNEVTRDDLDPEYILQQAIDGLAVVFAGYEDGELTSVLVLQFCLEAGKKGATVLALAGRGLLTFKRFYWKAVLDWLKLNHVKVLEACVAQEHVPVYKRKYGFDRAAGLVRMRL